MASDTFLRDWILEGEQDTDRIARFLKQIRTRFNTFTSFFVSDRTFNYYYGEGVLKRVDPNEPRDVWYFRVRQMTDDYEINVDPDMANRDAVTIFINYRVLGYDGAFLGAAGVGLAIDRVATLIEDYQRKYGRMIYFVNAHGEVTLAGSGFPKDVKNIAQLAGMSEVASAIRAGVESRIFNTHRDDVLHVSIRRISEFGWYLVVEQSEGKLLTQVFKALVINLLICALITLAVLVLILGILKAYQMKIETLRGIVPICSYCKQIRDDKGYWNQIEAYIASHTEAEFSHGICPRCMKQHFPEYATDADTEAPGQH
jgi:hypothetical protein